MDNKSVQRCFNNLCTQAPPSNASDCSTDTDDFVNENHKFSGQSTEREIRDEHKKVLSDPEKSKKPESNGLLLSQLNVLRSS